MGQDKGQVGTGPVNEQKSPDEIRREIEATRHELGDTAAALAEKTDVKARAKERVEGVKQTLAEKKETIGQRSPEGATSAATQVKSTAQQNPIPVAALAAFIGGFLFGRVTSRR